MTRLIIVIGLLVGIVLGLILVTLNPLSLMSAPAAHGTPAYALTYAPAEFRGFRPTPLAILGVGGTDPSGGGFTDAAIRYVNLSVMPVTRDSNSAIGVAVRMSAPARHNSLAKARLGLMTNMVAAWPEQGSLFLAGSENLWPIVRDCLWSLLRVSGFRPAPSPYTLAPVPGGATGRTVTGARGRLAGVRGAYLEIFEAVDDPADSLAGKRRLLINELSPPAPSQQDP